MIRYRDMIARELYTARQKRDANRRTGETTRNPDTAALCVKLAASLDAKIAALESELAQAPERPRDQGSYRRPGSTMEPLHLGYRTTPFTADELAAAAAEPLDIPDCLRRQP